MQIKDDQCGRKPAFWKLRDRDETQKNSELRREFQLFCAHITFHSNAKTKFEIDIEIKRKEAK